jgi:hypothetical protein
VTNTQVLDQALSSTLGFDTNITANVLKTELALEP